VHNAVEWQGYRWVDPGTLPTPEVHWRTGNPVLDSAFVGATSTPNWAQIAEQLRAMSTLPGFQGLYVRRDKHYLNVLFVQEFTDSPLAAAALRRELDIAWPNVPTLKRLLSQFHVSAQTQQAISAALASFGSPDTAGQPPEPQPQVPSAAPWTPQQLAVLKAFFDLFVDLWDTPSAEAIQLVIADNGLAPDAVGALESLAGVGRKDNLTLGMWAANAYVVGIDAVQMRAHGHVPAEFDVGALNQALGG
jgi:hypothetical protein